MSIPASICLKDTTAFYLPVDSNTGFCLCAPEAGLFDYNRDNTGSMKCAKGTLYNGYNFSEYTCNATLVQHNFKARAGCETGYTSSTLTGQSSNIKQCLATVCPTGWTLSSGSNCERTINGTVQKISLATLGYLAIPEGTPKYTPPAAPAPPPAVEVSTKKDYTQLLKILKYVGIGLGVLFGVLILMYLLSKLFNSSAPAAPGELQGQAPVEYAPAPAQAQAPVDQYGQPFPQRGGRRLKHKVGKK